MGRHGVPSAAARRLRRRQRRRAKGTAASRRRLTARGDGDGGMLDLENFRLSLRHGRPPQLL